MFRQWPQRLPSDVEVCALQPPGREGRIMDNPLATMDAMVNAIAAAIRPLLTTSYAFFGHSMGAVVAYEVIRTLRASGAAWPTHLFVSASGAPHVPDPDRHHLLRDDELIAVLRKEKWIPEELLDNRDYMEMLLPVIRADATVCETYCHQRGTPLECPITAFIGTRDGKVDADDIRAWKSYTNKVFREVTVDGAHDLIRTATNDIAAVVAAALATAR